MNEDTLAAAGATLAPTKIAAEKMAANAAEMLFVILVTSVSFREIVWVRLLGKLRCLRLVQRWRRQKRLLR